GCKNFEDASAFENKWSPRMEGVLHPAPVRERGLSAPDGTPGLSIICADFSLTISSSAVRLPFVVPSLNEGLVTDDVLDSLDILTTRAQEEGFAVVWAIHFPPDFPRHWFRQQLR